MYALNNPDTDWSIRKENMTFMDGFSGMSVVIERATSVIIEYVPVSHSPDALEKNRKIEQDLGLKDGALLSTRWINPCRGAWQGNRPCT